MKAEVKKSLVSAAAVLAGIGAITGGALWRDHMEAGTALKFQAESEAQSSSLVASTDNTVVPENKFFEDMLELLKRKYVDPISDDRKLADGAVRGMIASLGDPNSLFMDADQMKVYSAVRQGRYEGIGAYMALETTGHGPVKTSGDPEDVINEDARLPKLVVAAVVPGSSADKAGLKPGDWIEFLDDHWLPNSEALDAFQALQKQVQAGKAKGEEYLRMRRLLRERIEKSVLPIRARDRIMMGVDGFVTFVRVRGSDRQKLTLQKGAWQMPGFGVAADGSVRLPFVKDSAEKLRDIVAAHPTLKIDLRNNLDGDFDAMLACLRELAPAGSYGYLVTERQEKPSQLLINQGNRKPPHLTLIVDRTTRGAAEIFALALSSRGLAALEGSETAGERYVMRYTTLPSRAGYSLVTAEYRVNNPGIVADRTWAKREVGR